MSDKQILEMLSDIIEEIDYDYWKEYFLEQYANRYKVEYGSV